jgi:glycosyltransferase involved in cell wall biosynthesis
VRKVPESMAFLVLAYNHEGYIIEHLESIKYLIQRYAENIDVDIVVNDDCSKDRTVELVNLWLNKNEYLFRSVVTIFNKKNIGTCASVLNMLECVTADALKLTAGDDVYSYENIFEYVSMSDEVSILSGIPVSLVDGELVENKKDIFSIVSSQVIYKDKPLIDRFRFLSNNNAPNIVYNKKYLMCAKVKSYLSKFDVVEDWPLQISIAENFPATKFCLVNKVFVYYRRTPGSTYIVAGGRFHEDKCNIYQKLIIKEPRFFSKILLVNRLFCFKYGGGISNKLFNLAFYMYLFSLFASLSTIYKAFASVDLGTDLHLRHYILINKSANEFIEGSV